MLLPVSYPIRSMAHKTAFKLKDLIQQTPQRTISEPRMAIKSAVEFIKRLAEGVNMTPKELAKAVMTKLL